MTKEAIRNIYKNKRKEISLLEKYKLEDLLLINFQKLNLPFINYVHTYLAVDDLTEVDTENILRYLKFKNPGLIIAVPKINIETREMANFILDEKIKMEVNKFGIAEPVDGEIIDATDIDLVLTPLLAFDTKGYRVGYGKGFYDKFFKQCRRNIIKIGLSFFEAEEAIDDINQFDIPLNYCITPQRIYSFNQQ